MENGKIVENNLKNYTVFFILETFAKMRHLEEKNTIKDRSQM
jgi:hypothetical protein